MTSQESEFNGVFRFHAGGRKPGAKSSRVWSDRTKPLTLPRAFESLAGSNPVYDYGQH